MKKSPVVILVPTKVKQFLSKQKAASIEAAFFNFSVKITFPTLP
jgi:hypothetical protein